MNSSGDFNTHTKKSSSGFITDSFDIAMAGMLQERNNGRKCDVHNINDHFFVRSDSTEQQTSGLPIYRHIIASSVYIQYIRPVLIFCGFGLNLLACVGGKCLMNLFGVKSKCTFANVVPLLMAVYSSLNDMRSASYILYSSLISLP
jgi:hypothetical protein